MRPVPSLILTVLLLALCGLCGWQWWRENELRKIAKEQRDQIVRMEATVQEQDARIKAADAEVLRLTGSLAELRTNSVAKQDFDELKTAATQHVETINKQNEIIEQQNGVVEQLNASVLKANASIKSLASQRDELVKRVNDVTDQYNKLANPEGTQQNQNAQN